MRFVPLFLWLSLCSVALVAQTRIQIINYNVENFFHPGNDTGSVSTGNEFTPEGIRHWTYERYKEKLAHIGQVVANIGEWHTPALVGLEEVENEQCLLDLCKFGVLRNYRYRYLHRDSKDVRGIDCALLYHPGQFCLLHHTFISVPTEGRPTRDIVYASGLLQNGDTLHVFLCHFPSRRGTAETDSRRMAAQQTLQTRLDSLLLQNPMSRIVVMGDFNAAPSEQFNPLHNLMIDFENRAEGTYRWHGVWSCLDHFYVTANLLPYIQTGIYSPDWLLEDDLQYLGKKPFRTYQGYKYTGGYSDHLPVWMTITLPQ